MKYITKEVKIAFVAIVGIIVLFCGLQFLKGLSIYSSDSTYYVKFDNTGGISTNSPVYANGYKIGVVKSIKFGYGNGEPTLAEFALDSKMKVARGSYVLITSDMLGNIQANLVSGNDPTDILSEGDTIFGSQKTGALDAAGDLIPALEVMLPKLDSIMASLNSLLSDPALSNSLHNVETITGDLTMTTGQLNVLIEQISDKVPNILARTDTLLDNTNKITGGLSELDIAKTMAKVDATLDDVHKMSKALNSKEGTLGLLMRDPGLYNNLTSTMRDADSLLIDLKTHPKRYVHFSLFGKKDK